MHLKLSCKLVILARYVSHHDIRFEAKCVYTKGVTKTIAQYLTCPEMIRTIADFTRQRTIADFTRQRTIADFTRQRTIADFTRQAKAK